MVLSCERCGKPAAVQLGSSRQKLCGRCFSQTFERRVLRTLRKHRVIKHNQKIGFAISGGKDSIVAMHLIHKFYGKRKDLEFVAITVDEGIKGYREHGVSISKKNTKILGIEHHIISFAELYGRSLDEIASLKDSHKPCSYCGVFRRDAINTAARDLDVDILIFGHNADDEAQGILMNFFRGDFKRLMRMGVVPGIVENEKWIKRAKPLRQCLEKEVVSYALINRIEVDFSECPYATEAFRMRVRDILNKLESEFPGTKYTVLSTYDEIMERIDVNKNKGTVSLCKTCGEPTSQIICKACIYKKRIKMLENG